jgi:hypothetical protein
VSNQVLCRELTRHIFATLGAFPDGFGKVGLVHKDLQTKIKLQAGKAVASRPLWAGELKQPSGDYVALLADVGPKDKPDLVLVFGTLGGGENIAFAVGIRFEWFEEQDAGAFFSYHDGAWMPLGLAQKLQIGSMFEQQMQEGVPWTIPESCDKFYDVLGSLLELDEEVDNEEKNE